jgi:hypothetical protein
MALNLRHQTAAEFAARFWAAVRDAYQSGDKIRFCRLLYWLERRLDAGDITDAGARTSYNTAFGKSLNAAQWTTLRTTRIQPAHDRYAAILAEGSI